MNDSSMSGTLGVFKDQDEILVKIQESQDRLYKITPHLDLCQNEDCIGQNPICDHAKYMVSEIQKHNQLIKGLLGVYVDRYPEAIDAGDL